MESTVRKTKIICSFIARATNDGPLAESGPSLDFVNSFIGTQPHLWSVAASYQNGRVVGIKTMFTLWPFIGNIC